MTDATLIAANAATMSMVPNEPAQAQQEKKSPAGAAVHREPRRSRKFRTKRTIVARIPTPPWLARIGRRCNSNTKCIRRSTQRARVILDTHVTTGAVHDSQPYLEQLQRVTSDMRFTFARQWPIVATARQRSFDVCNNRESKPIFRCGAAAWGIASTSQAT